MGFFNKFSKDKDSSELKDILSIPYDYSGYDLVFEEGTTDPGVYAEINALVTNGGLDISEVDGYEDLSEDSSEDEFWGFYDNWIEALEENGFVTELTMADDIGAFAEEINRILRNIGAPELLNTEAAVSAFRAEVVKYSFQGKPVDENFKYDILEANIVCAELRKIGYELIAFFNGADNNLKAVIPVDRIAAMEELERRIK